MEDVRIKGWYTSPPSSRTPLFLYKGRVIYDSEDGTKGPHWSFEQAKQVMAQRGIECDPAEFWAALNMIYSDYVKVAKKFNVGSNIDFYVDMAKAFLDDKDAGPDKLAKYYQYVVR